MLLGGRAIQGIGGGGIIVLGLVIFTDIVPLRFRPKYYGIVQGAWAVGSCFGAVIGGALSQHTTWRWIFYLMFPFCAIGLLLVPLVVKLKSKKGSTLSEKLARVDWTGGFLFISSLTGFLIAISWGGTQEPWSSWRTIVPLVVGLAGITISAVWERYFAKEPFLKKALWCNWQVVAAYGGAMTQGLLVSHPSVYSMTPKSDNSIFTAIFRPLLHRLLLHLCTILLPSSNRHIPLPSNLHPSAQLYHRWQPHHPSWTLPPLRLVWLGSHDPFNRSDDALLLPNLHSSLGYNPCLPRSRPWPPPQLPQLHHPSNRSPSPCR